MEKHKETFFVIRLLDPKQVAQMSSIVDKDPIIHCDMMNGRDEFLNFAREKHYEFSTLRRAKFSTLALIYELHNQNSDKFVYTCNKCRSQMEIRYHCTKCEDYDLCTKCYETDGHNHPMDRLLAGESTADQQSGDGIKSDDANKSGRAGANASGQNKPPIDVYVKTFIHAVYCRNANCNFLKCAQFKRVLQHARQCQRYKTGACEYCRQLITLCYQHAKTCQDDNCQVMFCSMIKTKLKQQRALNVQAERRRMMLMNQTFRQAAAMNQQPASPENNDNNNSSSNNNNGSKNEPVQQMPISQPQTSNQQIHLQHQQQIQHPSMMSHGGQQMIVTNNGNQMLVVGGASGGKNIIEVGNNNMPGHHPHGMMVNQQHIMQNQPHMIQHNQYGQQQTGNAMPHNSMSMPQMHQGQQQPHQQMGQLQHNAMPNSQSFNTLANQQSQQQYMLNKQMSQQQGPQQPYHTYNSNPNQIMPSPSPNPVNPQQQIIVSSSNPQTGGFINPAMGTNSPGKLVAGQPNQPSQLVNRQQILQQQSVSPNISQQQQQGPNNVYAANQQRVMNTNLVVNSNNTASPSHHVNANPTYQSEYDWQNQQQPGGPSNNVVNRTQAASMINNVGSPANTSSPSMIGQQPQQQQQTQYTTQPAANPPNSGQFQLNPVQHGYIQRLRQATTPQEKSQILHEMQGREPMLYQHIINQQKANQLQQQQAQQQQQWANNNNTNNQQFANNQYSQQMR